ncbi:MAG: hypothetical protein COW65_05055 [Cytophagales bacterium CG18_big_fil_WC_8_21_14_2_50_42_9]|nr:MAG: hypothetical protein COW65_05055 [Cytophagales bacterium CG18_big_fil_WC_8_21_14_2_50_42_9]
MHTGKYQNLYLRNYRITFTFFCLIYLLVLPVSKLGAQTDYLQEAVKKSFYELNQVRQNPALYAAKYKLSALKKISKIHALTWDTTLARLAQQKADDMAKHNYFSHQDKKGRGMNYYLWKANYPLPANFSKKANDNGVESIAANTEGPEGFIQQLIVDQGVRNLGHRKHLLGLEHFKENTHVGIGIAYNPKSTYKYYCSILIAPRTENM